MRRAFSTRPRETVSSELVGKRLRAGLRQRGWDVADDPTPIVPVVVGEAAAAMTMAAKLEEAGYVAIKKEFAGKLPKTTYRLTDLVPTPVATIERAVAIGRGAGLSHVYSGNVIGGDEDTNCAGCGDVLIRRRGFSARPAPALIAGRCDRCGHVLAGIGMAELAEAPQ